MENEVKLALFDQFNRLDGKLFALQRAVRVLIARDPRPGEARAAIEANLDRFIANASLSDLSAERRASMREVRARLLAIDDPA
jgi:hypothetical protein